MPFTDHGREAVAEIARRHGFSPEAAEAMLDALVRGSATQAQFNHPEFGGMGQWSGGGMLMIGDMFNTGLKARVDDLIRDLSGLARALAQRSPAAAPGKDLAGSAWPAELGAPSSTGAQNGVDYAVFPETRRLAIRQGGQLALYDTGDHRIGSVSQQQGPDRSLLFTSQHGPVALDSLTPVTLPDQSGETQTSEDPPAARRADASITATIEQLHDLLSRGILTQDEFDAKKAELLGRL